MSMKISRGRLGLAIGALGVSALVLSGCATSTGDTGGDNGGGDNGGGEPAPVCGDRTCTLPEDLLNCPLDCLPIDL